MDELAKKMDVSAAKASRLSAVCHTVPVPGTPFSPWLRLAHISATAPGHSTRSSPLRVIQDYEIVLQLEDSSWIWSQTQNGSFDIRPGEVAFIPPNYAHAWGANSGSHLAVHFDLHAQPTLSALENIRLLEGIVSRRPTSMVPSFVLQPSPSTSSNSAMQERDALVLPLITKVRAPATWRQRLHPLVELYQRHAHHSTHGQMLAAEILLWAVRTLREDSHHEPALTATQRRLLEFLADWEEASRLRPTAPPAVAHLARQLNLSETGLRDAFHRATGRSPRCYFEERRVERAARLLLATDRSINDVARAEGYEDPYHFSRVFKRVTGRSPRQYRQGIGSPSGSQV